MDWVLAPIYKKGAKMLSGKEATGKNPVEEAHKRSLNRDDAALIIENNPSVGAVGLFTGPKGKGIVILDVDFQLSNYRKKETLSFVPVVRLTKSNAAKFIFRVPKEFPRMLPFRTAQRRRKSSGIGKVRYSASIQEQGRKGTSWSLRLRR